jgi:hypothetical protein
MKNDKSYGKRLSFASENTITTETSSKKASKYTKDISFHNVNYKQINEPENIFTNHTNSTEIVSESRFKTLKNDTIKFASFNKKQVFLKVAVDATIDRFDVKRLIIVEMNENKVKVLDKNGQESIILERNEKNILRSFLECFHIVKPEDCKTVVEVVIKGCINQFEREIEFKGINGVNLI